MADDFSATLRRAEREGWATYQPTPFLYLAGALAALGVMLGPLPVHFVVSLIAVIGEIIRHGRVDLYSTLYPGYRALLYYVVEVWPFILGGTVLGVPLAYLRQRRGFYYHEVHNSRTSYRRRSGLQVYPHVLILYVAGPVILWSMATYVNPRVYPNLLYNAFAVWLAVGVGARFVWEWLQVGLLRVVARWLGQPRRSLAAEYQLKGLVENDPTVSHFSVWDVAVDRRNRHAVLVGNIKGDAPLRRLKQLVAFIEGVDTVEVNEGAHEIHLPPTPVARTARSV